LRQLNLLLCQLSPEQKQSILFKIPQLDLSQISGTTTFMTQPLSKSLCSTEIWATHMRQPYDFFHWLWVSFHACRVAHMFPSYVPLPHPAWSLLPCQTSYPHRVQQVILSCSIQVSGLQPVCITCMSCQESSTLLSCLQWWPSGAVRAWCSC